MHEFTPYAIDVSIYIKGMHYDRTDTFVLCSQG